MTSTTGNGSSSNSFSSASSSVKSTSEGEASLIFLQTIPVKNCVNKCVNPIQSTSVATKASELVSTRRKVTDTSGQCTTPGDAVPVPMPLACKICSEQFSSRRMKNLHERVAHHRVPCHRCPHCAGIFGHIVDLNTHLLNAHRGSRYSVHCCTECDASFANNVLLRQHTATHARRQQKKLVRCTRCEFQHHSLGQVRFHMADRHAVWDPVLGTESAFGQVSRRGLGNCYQPDRVLLLGD